MSPWQHLSALPWAVEHFGPSEEVSSLGRTHGIVLFIYTRIFRSGQHRFSFYLLKLKITSYNLCSSLQTYSIFLNLICGEKNIQPAPKWTWNMTPAPVPLQRFWYRAQSCTPSTCLCAPARSAPWTPLSPLTLPTCQDRTPIYLAEGATLCAPFHPNLGKSPSSTKRNHCKASERMNPTMM